MQNGDKYGFEFSTRYRNPGRIWQQNGGENHENDTRKDCCRPRQNGDKAEKTRKPENNTKVPPQTFPAPKTIILQLYYSIVKLIVGLVENIRKMYQNELW